MDIHLHKRIDTIYKHLLTYIWMNILPSEDINKVAFNKVLQCSIH
jgi:hypothetical protein